MRAAGRRKLHIRRRASRAERIREMISDMLGGEWCAEELRTGGYGATSKIADGYGVSLSTASRDLFICRRMLAEFQGLFGREFNLSTDEVVWTWDRSRYGFRETRRGKTATGSFLFSTRPAKGN